MSSIASIKAAMHWQPLKRRAACVNCMHVEERLTVGISTWWCKSGNFLTHALAICNRHHGIGQAPKVMPDMPGSRA